MSVYRVGMLFDHVIQLMKWTNRKAIRTPETLPDGGYKVFMQDATLTVKRTTAGNISAMRIIEIGAPEKPASEVIKTMRASLKLKLGEVTGVEWSVASKVNVPKYQFLFVTGTFKALSPEFDLNEVFSNPPDLEQLAGMIGAVYKEKSNNVNKEESKTNG